MKKRTEDIKQYSLRIPDELLREARKKCIDNKTSLRQIMEKFLTLWTKEKIKI